MPKRKIVTGDICRITLPKGLGFGYGKYIDLPTINPRCRYPSLVRIFNIRTIDPKEEIDDLSDHHLLFSPLLIAGIIDALKEGTWTVIGNIPLGEGEEIIPHYKLKEDEWFYVIDTDKFDKEKKRRSTLEEVKHLEELYAIGACLLPTKMAMAFLRDEGRSIHDYFELNEYFEKVYYDEVMAIPHIISNLRTYGVEPLILMNLILYDDSCIPGDA